MKRFLMIMVLFVGFNAYAQNPKTTPTRVTDKTIVKGEDGTLYTYAIWSKLMQIGHYSLRPAQGEEFVLFRLTPEQAEKNIERQKNAILNMPRPRASDVFVEGEKFRTDKFTSLNKVKPTHVIVGKDGIIKFSTVGLAPNTLTWIKKTLKEQL